MVGVEVISVDLRMPSDHVCVVAMQPFIQLHSLNEEPFRWSDDATGQQLEAIRRTLACARVGLEGRPASFTLFPEYSVPGIAGATGIDEAVTSGAWPNNSVVIAGVHGITKSEYGDLCDALAVRVSPSCEPDAIPDDQWVNSCLTWIADREGTVYVFECRYEPDGYPCRFVTFMCFDWVASLAGAAVCDEVLDRLNDKWAGSPKPLHWVFVIQHNPEPNHPSFLGSTYRFLTDVNAFPFVERKEAIVLHANTAVSALPARAGQRGFSACVFSPSAQLDCDSCRPTVCMQAGSLRGTDMLGRCKDVVFREMGECIHVFGVRVPRFVTPDARDRTYPLTCAQVHPASETTDPRLCGGPVPAAVKWLNDALDCMSAPSETTLAGCALQREAEVTESAVVDAMRTADGRTAHTCVNWAACSFSQGRLSRDGGRCRNADRWAQPETDALEHVVHSLTSLGLTYELEIAGAALHGALRSDSGCVQVVAIRGETHEDCRRHYDSVAP